VRTVIRVAIGLALAAGGLTCLVYGVAQAIENGSCGTGENGVSYGAPCPSGFGAMILLMVLGTFVAIFGAALAGVIARFLPTLFVAVGAGVVLGIVDQNPNDSRPGYEVLLAVLIPLALFTLPGVGRRRAPIFASAPPPAMQTAPPIDAPVQWQQTEDVASRLRQLEQLKQSGLMSEAEYTERRQQILAGL
jgi:hypothetical protein